MTSHPFSAAVDPDTRARRVHEFVVNVTRWVTEYREDHPNAPVDETYRLKQFRRAASAEDEEARILRPTPGDVDPDSTIAAVANSKEELRYLRKQFAEWVASQTTSDNGGHYYQN
ncbi:uncharacterized protein SCHCODRAFT_02515489 [Schizophyllum commune H4-8]|nr:uncharacterized protein SCHCODRAFT_02515489 [Schizophyllum commune H4-8]KAI5887945.1 hypothetical protein SCHCODRAFT_02515489 [Schizophyllum commune H4-8]